LLAAAAILTACTSIFDLGRIAAIDLLDGKTVDLEEGQSRQLRARAVTAGGDTVPDAVVSWERVDLDSGVTTFTIDSSGLVTALAPGLGRVVASVEELRSSPSIAVSPQPDVVLPTDSQRFSVAAADTMSVPLNVSVLDLTSSIGDSLPLSAKPVIFRIVDPAVPLDIALAFSNLEAGDDPGMIAGLTNASGVASVVVLRRGTALDSAIVEAVATTATGDTVPGSPVRFVVLFEQE